MREELLKMKYDNYDEDAIRRSRKRKSQLMKIKDSPTLPHCLSSYNAHL